MCFLVKLFVCIPTNNFCDLNLKKYYCVVEVKMTVYQLKVWGTLRVSTKQNLIYSLLGKIQVNRFYLITDSKFLLNDQLRMSKL